MSRQNKQIAFRPPPDLAARIAEYQRIEHRGSTNEALIVLVMDALERWRVSKLRQGRGDCAPNDTRAPGDQLCAKPRGHAGDCVGFIRHKDELP